MKRIEVMNEIVERRDAQLYEITKAGWNADEINALIDNDGLTQEEAVSLVKICRFALTYTNLAAHDAAEAAATAAVQSDDLYRAQCEYDAAWVAAYDGFDNIGSFRAKCIENNR